MSSNLIVRVWESAPLSGARLLALQAIAEASNEQGSCYLPVRELAVMARLSQVTMYRAVLWLRRERWIVSSRILGKGGQLVNQINTPKLARSQRDGHDARSVEAARNRQTGATEAGLLTRVSVRAGDYQNDRATVLHCDDELMLLHGDAEALARVRAARAASQQGASSQPVGSQQGGCDD